MTKDNGSFTTKELVTNLLTTGIITLRADAETANASQAITISNVGPAGVGTATISKWLTIVGSDGVTYYIPMWT